MQAKIQLPRAFSVRDDHEFYPIQHLLARLNPELMVIQVATGMHVNGGCTVLWGVVYLKNHKPSQDEIEAALKEAGFDLSSGGRVDLPNLLTGQTEAEQP